MEHALIRSSALFKNATDDDLRALVAIAEPLELRPGETLWEADQEPNAMYIVELGTVDLRLKGQERPVATFGSRQSLGTLGLFHRGTRGTSARAREETHLVRVSFDNLTTLLAQRPAFAAQVYLNAATFLAKHVAELVSERDRPYF